MPDLPYPTLLNLREEVRAYWLKRVRQHTTDSYAGIPLSKFPEDLRTYEHIMWLDRPDTIVEIGTQFGGSALWFRDRLRTLENHGLICNPRVITVDLHQAGSLEYLTRADPQHEQSIHLLEGDVRDEATIAAIADLVGSRCMVIEDSAHEYDTTHAALVGCSPFVPSGGFLVVEDGCVDIEEMRLTPDWPRGVLAAIDDWLNTDGGVGFTQRRDLELYGVTCHPGGYLQRRAA